MPQIQTDRAMSNLQRLLGTPTAPFHEARVREEIEDMLRPLPRVRLRRDDFENLLAFFECEGTPTDAPRLAFVVHMDHPGWITPRGDHQAQHGLPYHFAGGVPQNYLYEPDVVDYGNFAMWNLPAWDVRGDYILSRACDDLAGCAMLVSMLQELEECPEQATPSPVAAIFTRAEEVGLLGSLQLAESQLLPPQTPVISIETSSCKPPAQFGKGPIVRVGDRATVFSQAVTAHLMEVARTEELPVQRCLMDGGVCEASVFGQYGYSVGGICLPLGNYHNCGGNDEIMPEFIHSGDFLEGIRLLTAAALHVKAPRDHPTPLRERLNKRLEEYRAYF